MVQAGVYRDWSQGPQSWSVTSVGSKTSAISAGGVPILTFGWLDVGTANGVLSEFASMSNTQESWIGPWSHGQGHIADPFQPGRTSMTAAEHQQLNDLVYAFFDRYVKGDARPGGTRVLHYYTLNAGTWHTTTRWPVAGTHVRRLYFGAGHTLTWQQCAVRPGSDLLHLNPTTGTGHLDRWNTNLTGDRVVYANRAAVDHKLLTCTSAPLRQATTVTGLGRVTLQVTGVHGARHGALYAYLEDVGSQNRTPSLPKSDNPDLLKPA